MSACGCKIVGPLGIGAFLAETENEPGVECVRLYQHNERVSDRPYGIKLCPLHDGKRLLLAEKMARALRSLLSYGGGEVMPGLGEAISEVRAALKEWEEGR